MEALPLCLHIADYIACESRTNNKSKFALLIMRARFRASGKRSAENGNQWKCVYNNYGHNARVIMLFAFAREELILLIQCATRSES